MAISPVLKTAKVVFGLGFGDEGKGTLTDYFSRQVEDPLVVRFNGGAQAAHNVVTSEGLHHTFQQFGAGSLAGARTLLSRFTLVDPIRLAAEATELSRKLKHWALDRHMIDAAAPLLTPFHAAVNRIKERSRGAARHGSCGNGIGELMADLTGGIKARPVLRMGLLRLDLDIIIPQLQELQWQCMRSVARLPVLDDNLEDLQLLKSSDKLGELAEAYVQLRESFCIMPSKHVRTFLANAPNIIFEGAQGVLLDETYGFPPYYTWSNCTPANAYTLLKEADCTHEVRSIGVLRSHCTRHGAGPMPNEQHVVTPDWFPGEHNKENPWQGAWRSGAFDLQLAEYAGTMVRDALGAWFPPRHVEFDLALTHMDIVDRAGGQIPLTREYSVPDDTTDDQDLEMIWADTLAGVSFPDDMTDLTAFLTNVDPGETEYLSVDSFIDAVGAAVGAKVKYISRGPTAADKEAL